MGIGALNETPLHAALKVAIAPPGSRFEVPVAGFVIDAVHDDLLIEVQTRHVGAMRRKLEHLLPEHRVRLVLPIATERWIVKRADPPTRRRSPKRGHPADVARELVAIPHLLDHPHLEIEIVLLHEEEVREHRPGQAWRRRGWVTVDRRLLEVVERRRLGGSADLLAFVPDTVVDPFDTAELALASGMARRTAQQLVYCLRIGGALTAVGKAGNAHLYARLGARDAGADDAPA
ncbi:MAG: hypothetical protein P1P87_12520 [Trueperaceae bacterium]|nr:hypothetical protein [Trueperaceae bacterium]